MKGKVVRMPNLVCFSARPTSMGGPSTVSREGAGGVSSSRANGKAHERAQEARKPKPGRPGELERSRRLNSRRREDGGGVGLSQEGEGDEGAGRRGAEGRRRR